MSGERVERCLAADVTGYSPLMGWDEAGRLARFKALRCELIAPKIADHKDCIIKTSGDGMLVEPIGIVKAVAVQHKMAQCNARTAQDQRIQLRIGIDSGVVIVEDGDIRGDGVDIEARLEGITEPDRVCLSDDAYREVQGKVDARVCPAGREPVISPTAWSRRSRLH